MDSKLKRICILGSMGVILLVAVLVLYANPAPRGGGQGTGQPTPKPQSQDIIYDEYGQRIGLSLIHI